MYWTMIVLMGKTLTTKAYYCPKALYLEEWFGHSTAKTLREGTNVGWL